MRGASDEVRGIGNLRLCQVIATTWTVRQTIAVGALILGALTHIGR
ncbi:MAG TPA: hypothetical protein VIC29_13765 [Steroidobacteraceae bacterium]|jgi:hypothetical protein